MTDTPPPPADRSADPRTEIDALQAELAQTKAARDALLEEVLPLAHGHARRSGRWLRVLGVLVSLVALVIIVDRALVLVRLSDKPPAQQSDTSPSPTRKTPVPSPLTSGRRMVTLPIAEATLLGRAALHPDGCLAALADSDGRVLLYNLCRNRVRRTLVAHSGAVRDLAFGANGDLVTGGADGAVQLWRTSTGERIRYLRKTGAPVRAVAVHDRLVAVAGETGAIQLYSLTDAPPQTLSGHRGWVYALAFASDGSRLASGGQDGQVRLWNLAAKDLAAKPSSRVLGKQGSWIGALAFSPADQTLASGGFNGQIRLWPLGPTRTKRPSPLTTHVRRVTSLAFHQSGKRLASASLDRRAILWDLTRNQPQRILADHAWQVSTVAFDPQQRFLLTASTDGTVRLWPDALPWPTTAQLLPAPRPHELTFRRNTSGQRVRLALRDATGTLLPNAQAQLADIFRSTADDQTTPPDPNLIALIERVADHFGREREIVIVSGYRSPTYNTLRRAQSRDVSEKSAHIAGKALDFRIQGIPITTLRDYVKSLQAGGVGFYADSQFVHMDVGRVRSWEGD